MQYNRTEHTYTYMIISNNTPLRRGAASASGARLLGPQSQSFSRSYGSILPTSLIYIVLSTRGCSPWRPDAVMSTTKGANKSLQWIFKGLPAHTEQVKD